MKRNLMVTGAIIAAILVFALILNWCGTSEMNGRPTEHPQHITINK